MVSLSVDGLISGLDTTSLVSQLVAAEALPQTRLKNQMSAAQDAADAYREVNTKVDAVRTAAAALSTQGLAAARTATSSTTSVTASAGTTAVPGSRLSFTVTSLASTASYLSGASWASTSTDVGTPTGADAATPAPSPWPLTISRPDGTETDLTPPAGATLAQTVAYINGLPDAGVRATAVNTGNGYRLQLTSTTSGADGDFDVATTAGTAFTQTSLATNAVLDLGGVQVASSTNTFKDLMTGVSVTVTEKGAAVVEVTEDPKSVAAKVKTLVDAVNSALDMIKKHGNSEKGSAAALKGDFELRTLTSQLLQTMSDAVSGAGSPGLVGIDLTREGTVRFTEATFLATLASDPGTVQRMFAGAPAVDARPATATTPAVDAQEAVDGLSQRLEALTKRTTNATTGTLTLLAQGRETLVNDFKSRIADWDLRLAARKETLTRQFTAMETALSSLKNQSTWLAGQLGSLSG